MNYCIRLFLLGCVLSAPFLPAMNIPQLDTDGRLFDIFDDPTIEEDLCINGFLDTVSLDAIHSRKIEPDMILPLLADKGIFDLLDIDFYKRTNPFAQRSLLDYPIFEIHKCANPKGWTAGFHIFWNHMNRSVFCGTSTNISSYLNFDQETLFGKIEELLYDPMFDGAATQFSDLIKDVDFDEILDLFADFTVEQRRVGAMFHAWHHKHRTEFRALMPLYYLERNIFAEPAKQFLIEQKFGVLDTTSQEQFEKNHAISDRVGLGDLRLEYDYAVYKTETTSMHIGAMATLPTSVTIAKGLRGTSFENSRCQPTLNLQSLLDLITINEGVTIEDQETAVAILVGDICRNKNGFLLGALDRFNAILLDEPLGNYRHVGIGFLFRAHTSLDAFLEEFSWSKRINFNNRLSLEYNTPADETRFFAIRNTAADIAAHNFSSDNPEIAQENLIFIQNELINKFYPIALKTRVQPGLIFRYTTRWCFDADAWDFNIGSDIWIQGKEKFEHIKTPSSLIRDTIDIANATRSLAYQIKYFGSIGFKVQRDTHSWFISVNADGTSWNKGIGKDYIVSINLEANF